MTSRVWTLGKKQSKLKVKRLLIKWKLHHQHLRNLKIKERICDTPFTPSNAKLVNEMLLGFKNISTKFPYNFFFKTNINLTFKTTFLLRPYQQHLYIIFQITFIKIHQLHKIHVLQLPNQSKKKNDVLHRSGRVYTAHFSSLALFLLILTYTKTLLIQ